MAASGPPPLMYRMHAANAILLGVGLTWFPNVIATSAPFTRLSRYFNLLPPGAAASGLTSQLTQSETQSLTTAGLLFTAIGLIYIPSWNVPAPRNAFMYASVPLRLTMAAMAAVHWVARPESRDLFKLAIIVEDGLGALLLGWMIGSFSGRRPGR